MDWNESNNCTTVKKRSCRLEKNWHLSGFSGKFSARRCPLHICPTRKRHFKGQTLPSVRSVLSRVRGNIASRRLFSLCPRGVTRGEKHFRPEPAAERERNRGWNDFTSLRDSGYITMRRRGAARRGETLAVLFRFFPRSVFPRATLRERAYRHRR